jgi:hypothetical protein
MSNSEHQERTVAVEQLLQAIQEKEKKLKLMEN